MGLVVANNVVATLQTGVAPADTALTLASGQGARFPALSGGDYTYATVLNVSNQLEIVKVTDVTGDVLTVERGVDDTTAMSFVPGDRVELRPTAAMFNEIVGEVDQLGTAAYEDVEAFAQLTGGDDADFATMPKVDGKELTEYFGSQPSITGTIYTNGTSNNIIKLPTDHSIQDLGLEVGDVIKLENTQDGLNDKLFTVEVVGPFDNGVIIIDEKDIIVNYEHAGNRGDGPLRLNDVTSGSGDENVTITRFEKWWRAPLGLGQAWVDVKSIRAKGANYTGLVSRSIYVSAYGTSTSGGGQGAELSVDGITVFKAFVGSTFTKNTAAAGIIPPGGVTYNFDVTNNGNLGAWAELR